jgi:hypothetical protein
MDNNKIPARYKARPSYMNALVQCIYCCIIVTAQLKFKAVIIGKLSHLATYIWRVCGSLMFLLEPKGRGGGKQRGPLLLLEYSNSKLITIILCMQYDDEHCVHELPKHLLQLSDHGAHAVR